VPEQTVRTLIGNLENPFVLFERAGGIAGEKKSIAPQLGDFEDRLQGFSQAA